MTTGSISSTDLDNTVAESSSETEVKVIKCNHKWTIKNFSFCLTKPGVPLHSRIFGSEIHEGIEWRLTLYPRGKGVKSKGSVAYSLELVTSSYGDVAVKFNLSILNRNGEKIYSRETVESRKLKPTQSIEDDNYVSQERMFHKNCGLLHNDNLTIYCEIVASPGIPRMIQSSSAKYFIKLSYKWVIEDFRLHAERRGKEVVSPVFFYPARCKLKWQLRFVPYHSNGPPWIALYLCSVSDNKTNVTVSVKLFFINLNREKGNILLQSGWTFDKEPSRQGWQKLEKRYALLNEEDGFLPGGKLTILCKMAYSAEYHDDVAESDPTMPAIPACRLLDDLEMLFATKNLSDVTLVVGEREIQAHKTVLVARSSVFSAMFEHQMEEQTSNRVEINDIDCEVLNEMLRFMYTGKANLASDMAAELLKAADKYDIHRLKVICERELFSHIAIEK